MDYLFLTAIIALLILVIWIISRYAKTGKKLKNESEYIRVHRNTIASKICIIPAFIWVLLAGSLVYFDTYEIHEIKSGLCDDSNRVASRSIEEHRELLLKKPVTHRKWYSLLGITWALYGVLCVVDFTIFKYSNITANGVYQPDCFIPAEKLTYILNDNSLELYTNNQKSPKKYTVIEDKDNLEKLLSDNYCIKQLKKNID